MSDEIKIYIMIIIKNIVAIICFTILAVVFKKWWIALFSLLFYSIFKSDEETYWNRYKTMERL